MPRIFSTGALEMAMRADDLIDRRRLRRKLTFWRVAALGIIAVGLAAAGLRLR